MTTAPVMIAAGMDRKMRTRPNENKMSDGGRPRASLGVEVWKSFESGPYSGSPFAPSLG
jgi:hypothetical protein